MQAPTESSTRSHRQSLEPGDEVVRGWPSFPSYVNRRAPSSARTRGAFRSATIATTSRRLLDAIDPRTKLVYVCNPNNPTGTMSTRAELDACFERVPDHVLTVLDQAYFEYIDDPDYPDGIEEYLKAGRRVARPADVLEDLRARRPPRRLRRRPRPRS